MIHFKWGATVILLFAIIGFQNCSKMNFASNNQNQDFASMQEYEPEVTFENDNTQSEASTTTEAETPVPAPTINLKKEWLACDDSYTRIGQLEPSPGVSCTEVCISVGKSCLYRAAQADFNACVPANPPRSGHCDDVPNSKGSSQCVCQ